jgi:bifunctional non-homologous end joining protein LigD
MATSRKSSPASSRQAKTPARLRVDPLAKYRSKRHFDRTPEPAPGKRAAAGGARFVVQKHDARRLHYDFRLELDGTMKSWAVTRGPSLDPADRRLAVHVEDHPIAYNDFEGTIPKGQYGGGTVMLWDRGEWEPLGDPRRDYAQGKLKFRLHGEHLKGGWTLVRMRGKDFDKGHDNWLLIKERDEFAQPGDGERLLARVTKSVASGRTMEQLAGGKPGVKKATPKRAAARTARPETSALSAVPGAKRGPLPDFVAPELATLVDRPPKGEGWVHEIKIDGYRAYCRRDGDEVRFMTRTGKDWTRRFRNLVNPVKSLPARQFALDGEITVLDGDGVSSFSALQEALSTDDQRALAFLVFDLLHLDGYDLRNAALTDRKRLLADLLARAPGKGPVRYSDHVEATGDIVYQHACQMALEGVVSKQADQPYQSGRGGAWLKSKCVARQEFVIIGFTHPKAGARGIGALLLGYHDDGRMVYAGRVGTGFSDPISRQLRAKLRKLETKTAAAEVPAAARRGVFWVEPELTCDVEFLSWTPDGLLRHPSFQGLREDKKPADIIREKPTVAPASKPAPQRKSTSAATVAGIAITHPDRLVFPEAKATKLDLARYYETVADWMLPEIRERPLSLLRCPEGIAAQCFFQKHFKSGELKALPRIAIEEQEGRHEYLMVRTAADIVALVQNGVIEFHPWGARGDDPDKPDRLIFDLDPSSPAQWKRVVETAVVIRDRLQELGLKSFAKTTGGKGLHVVVPLQRRPGWDEAKEFTRALAESLVTAVPALFTINPLKQRRAGKIFIDYLRNDRGQTGVAPYSVRARDGAGVAMPLEWDEVTPDLRPGDFTLRTVPDLLRKRTDPWRDMAKTRQHLTAAARRALGLSAT